MHRVHQLRYQDQDGATPRDWRECRCLHGLTPASASSRYASSPACRRRAPAPTGIRICISSSPTAACCGNCRRVVVRSATGRPLCQRHRRRIARTHLNQNRAGENAGARPKVFVGTPGSHAVRTTASVKHATRHRLVQQSWTDDMALSAIGYLDCVARLYFAAQGVLVERLRSALRVQAGEVPCFSVGCLPPQSPRSDRPPVYH